ncbi:hypothetical protein ACLTEW_23505 [Gordonia lacunae]|uniref:hypothetical protein n=1 Tax=Gordonia lacunae TaxID=417102 RepID=UPI0039E39A92
MRYQRSRQLVVRVFTVLFLLVFAVACNPGEASVSSDQDGIYAALDRYQNAKSTGSRRDILSTLTADSPQRQFLAGSDEDYAITREMLDSVRYRQEYTKRRDLKVTGDDATLIADFAETRDDRSDDRELITTVSPGILIEAKKVNGTWMIHDVVSEKRQQLRQLGGS